MAGHRAVHRREVDHRERERRPRRSSRECGGAHRLHRRPGRARRGRAAAMSYAAGRLLRIPVVVLIIVIVLGAREDGGHFLPVFGFGYDEHIVLPLISISIPAIAYTAQLTATRMQDVLDAEFVTTANAKGLLQSRIVFVHVLPHVRPVLFEALGSGLRVSVASLPIIEFLFNWNGIGALSLQAIGSKDSSAFVFTALVLVAVFAVLGAIADLSRPRVLYRSA